MTAAFLGCAPTIAEERGVISEPSVVAIVAEPPEATPGQAVTYTAYAMTPDGVVADNALADALTAQWAYCTEAKPPLEDNAVPRSCLHVAADGAVAGTARADVGSGISITTAMPVDACRLFGPDLPPGGLRPRDPDATGGFYQPIVILPAMAAYAHRVRCGLPTATPAIDRAFRETYRENTNPIIESITATEVAAQVVEISVAITGASAETYVLYDPRLRTLVTATEQLDVQFVVTKGSLSATHIAPSQVTVGSTTALAATVSLDTGGFSRPIAIGTVVRDSRGGTQFLSYLIE